MKKNLMVLGGLVVLMIVMYPEAPPSLWPSKLPLTSSPAQVSTIATQLITTKSAAPFRKAHENKAQLDLSQENSLALPGLPRGSKYLPFVKAIENLQFRPEMGVKLLSQNGLTFYRTTSTSSPDINVAYNFRKNSLQPMTATIKLSGINQETRRQILKGHLSEFYYHEDLAIQYLQSSHAQLLADVEDLKEKGFEPNFEIIDGLHQLK